MKSLQNSHYLLTTPLMEFIQFLSTYSQAFSLLLLLSLLWIPQYFLKKYFINKHLPPPPPEAAGAWPLIGHGHLFLGPNPAHITLTDLANKHGPIFTVKLGVRRTLIVSSWEIAKQCFTTNDKAFANRPNTLAIEIMTYNRANFGFSNYGPLWRQARKIVTLELLSSYRSETFKHVRESEIRESCVKIYKFWENDNNGYLEMKKWFSDVVLDIVLRIVVWKKYTTSSEENKRWRKALSDFYELTGRVALSDALPYLRWLDIGGDEKLMIETSKELDLMVGEWLREHKDKRLSGEKNLEEDFMDVLISILERDPNQFLDNDVDTMCKATCMTIILAAADTTTVTLTWALSLLLNNSSVLKKLQHELDTNIGKERLVEESDIKNLNYLQAVLKETLRLYPAGPLGLPHEAMEDCTVNGYHIKAGTQLLNNISRIQRDERVWTDPNEFKPERFLTTNKDVDVRGQNFELMPFGSGRRMCPGISLAFQLLSLTLANLLHGFDLEPRDYPVDMRQGKALTNLKLSPLEVRLVPRLSSRLYC